MKCLSAVGIAKSRPFSASAALGISAFLRRLNMSNLLCGGSAHDMGFGRTPQKMRAASRFRGGEPSGKRLPRRDIPIARGCARWRGEDENLREIGHLPPLMARFDATSRLSEPEACGFFAGEGDGAGAHRKSTRSTS